MDRPQETWPIWPPTILCDMPLTLRMVDSWGSNTSMILVLMCTLRIKEVLMYCMYSKSMLCWISFGTFFLSIIIFFWNLKNFLLINRGNGTPPYIDDFSITSLHCQKNRVPERSSTWDVLFFFIWQTKMFKPRFSGKPKYPVVGEILSEIPWYASILCCLNALCFIFQS